MNTSLTNLLLQLLASRSQLLSSIPGMLTTVTMQSSRDSLHLHQQIGTVSTPTQLFFFCFLQDGATVYSLLHVILFPFKNSSKVST